MWNPEINQLMQAPYGWRHASLGELKTFLESEAELGRFRPLFFGGLTLKHPIWI